MSVIVLGKVKEGAYLSVDLIHRREIAREVGEVDVALDDRVTGDTSTLENLGQVLDGSTLRRSRQVSRRTIHFSPMKHSPSAPGHRLRRA